MLIPTLLCPKAWEKMSGDETTRFCSYCKKQVYNLEAMPVGERLALLSSPAGSICSRYKLAIRRPAKGQEDSYRKHLLKYGTGVALAGAVFAVLWEWEGNQEKQRYYRAAGISPAEQGMPRHYYDEHQVVAVGMLVSDLPPDQEIPDAPADLRKLNPLELKLDPAEVDRLIEQARPRFPTERPVVALKTD